VVSIVEWATVAFFLPRRGTRVAILHCTLSRFVSSCHAGDVGACLPALAEVAEQKRFWMDPAQTRREVQRLLFS
jgi:hypothetical protein